jgi:hypothetical protein
VVVLYTLARGKMVAHQPGSHPRDFVGTDRRTHTAAANRYSSLNFACGYILGKRDDEVRIIVV